MPKNRKFGPFHSQVAWFVSMLCPSVVWILKPKCLPHRVHLGWCFCCWLVPVGAPMTNNWWYVWVPNKQCMHFKSIQRFWLRLIEWMSEILLDFETHKAQCKWTTHPCSCWNQATFGRLPFETWLLHPLLAFASHALRNFDKERLWLPYIMVETWNGVKLARPHASYISQLFFARKSTLLHFMFVGFFLTRLPSCSSLDQLELVVVMSLVLPPQGPGHQSHQDRPVVGPSHVNVLDVSIPLRSPQFPRWLW